MTLAPEMWGRGSVSGTHRKPVLEFRALRDSLVAAKTPNLGLLIEPVCQHVGRLLPRAAEHHVVGLLDPYRLHIVKGRRLLNPEAVNDLIFISPENHERGSSAQPRCCGEQIWVRESGFARCCLRRRRTSHKNTKEHRSREVGAQEST